MHAKATTSPATTAGCVGAGDRTRGSPAKGHGKHVCRDCAKLGAEEIAYRQNVRNLERCVTWEGFIRRKERAAFDRFLKHEDPRVRAMAEELQRVDAQNREVASGEREADELAGDEAYFDGANDDGNPF